MVLILPIIFAIPPIGGSCYRVINSSILQDAFSSVLNFCHAMKKKQLRKDKKEWMLYDHVVWKYCFVIFTALQFPYVILCPN